MRDLGIDVRADRVYPDLAFALDAPALRTGAPQVVGIGVMNYRGAAGDGRGPRAQRGLPRSCQARRGSARRRGMGGSALHRGRRGRRGAAADHAATAPSGTAHAGAQITAEAVGSLAELMDVVAGVDLVVASRYHNLLCALTVGIPALSISYARKNDAMLGSMGLGEFCHPGGEIDLDRLVAQFRELDRRRDELVAGGWPGPTGGSRRGVARQLDDLAGFLRGVTRAEPQMSLCWLKITRDP